MRPLRLLAALLLPIVWLSLKPPAGAFAASVVGTSTSETSDRLRLVQVLEDGKGGVEGLFGPLAAAVSPDDGANVYVTSWWGDAVAVFARDAQSGRLTFLEVHRNGVNGVDGLGNANGVAVSPDGAHVYVIGEDSAAITGFARDPPDG